MKSVPLKSFRLRNFKAIQDSGVIHFNPLTVLIGNNGSGKSSLIEGLKTFREVSEDDLVEVFQRWHGYENIWYKGQTSNLVSLGKRGSKYEQYDNPIGFDVKGHYEYGSCTVKTTVGLSVDNGAFISHEEVTVGRQVAFSRDARGRVRFKGKAPAEFGSVKIETNVPMDPGLSIIGEIPYLDKIVSDWQFLGLDPIAMSEPGPLYRTKRVELNEDAANIAEYLLEIKNIDQSAYDGIVETLKYILPYAQDLQPRLVSGLEQVIYLEMTEGQFSVPSWMLSTGTLRLVGILALLRHPEPPPLIVIEEIENGLDPRTLSLIVDEIRNALEAGKTQIIATTHSPYFLDLLDLSQIVLVERVDGRQPTFVRPADQEYLIEWSKNFSPGQLYTMDLLHRKTNA
jgi:predicted ATPase